MKHVGIVILIVTLFLFGVVAYAKTMLKEPVCGIENCHGLDISCGPNVPEVCTAMYALGDFCRQFAQCQTVEGRCQLVPSVQFQSCKSCVQNCMDAKDPMRAFACESHCRDLFPIKGK
ncbi:MAG: hypothetical protein K8S27_16110 [Candidatus Omnitrophica bacterium]|nr:hypothetical protein [Candidatus Omnitrophota bacterium]